MAKVPHVDDMSGRLLATNLTTNSVTTVDGVLRRRVRSTLSTFTRRPRPLWTSPDYFTAHAGNVETISSTEGEWTFGISNGERIRYSGTAYYWLGYHQPTYASEFAVTSLDGRLRAKIKRQKVNLALVIAEYRKTASLLKEAFDLVHYVVRASRPGFALANTIAAVQRHLKTRGKHAARAALALQYGIRPLLSDIHGSAEAVAHATVGSPTHRLKTSVSAESYRSRADFKSLGRFGVVTPQIARTAESASESIRTSVFYNIDVPELKTLSELGFSNPVELAWQLLPFSFVVDWLVGVGDYLAGLDALVGIGPLKGCTTIRRVVNTSISLGGTVTYNQVSFTRTPRASLAMPKLYYSPSQSYEKIANGLLLLRNLR